MKASGLVGLGLLGLVSVAALVVPSFDAHTPTRKNAQTGLTDLGEPRAPSRAYPLGTDALGRCQVARLAAAGRLSLAVAATATGIALGLGTLVGVLAGTVGGLLDAAVMAICELMLAFPFALAVLALGAAVRDRAGNHAVALGLVLGLWGWAGAARAIRAKVRAVRAEPFVSAARAVGASPAAIGLRHVLPHIAGTALVLASRAAPAMILAEAALSYLGLGPALPAASWGTMLREGQAQLLGAPWLVLAPGIAILATALGCNLVADELGARP
jgi:peptide/nickel transport system permease protein